MSVEELIRIFKENEITWEELFTQEYIFYKEDKELKNVKIENEERLFELLDKNDFIEIDVYLQIDNDIEFFSLKMDTIEFQYIVMSL